VLGFYRASGLTEDEFAVIGDYLTVTNGSYLSGRVNVNTAPFAVLACLPGMSAATAQLLADFRRQSPDRLTSIAWVAEALAQEEAALQALSAVDCITSRSYQFVADIAAVGPHGRGYRRVRFVYDVSDGSPKIVYRQDLSHLGWALGPYVRRSHGPLRGIDPATGQHASR
jgi:type II secretory pathway component PulK